MRPTLHQAKIAATIVSLWHVNFPVCRAYQNYSIPARPDNGLLITNPEFSRTFGSLRIQDAHGTMDIGERRNLPQSFDAYSVADDIVANDGLQTYGVFVPDGDEPAKEELQIAQAILLRKARQLIQEGDIKYSKLETRREISDLNRWAVVQLEEKRDWVYVHTAEVKVALPPCLACGSEAKIPDPAVCWNCSYVMNARKARDLGILPALEGELVGVGAGAAPVRGPGGKFTPAPKEK